MVQGTIFNSCGYYSGKEYEKRIYIYITESFLLKLKTSRN